MSFPSFPIFRKFAPEDKLTYLEFYKHVEPYSDFSFNNLIIWLDLREDLEVSQYINCIILRFSNPFEHAKQEIAYTILGNENCLRAVEAIFAYQEALGQEPRLFIVPECVVSDILQTHKLPQNLVIKASTDHCDYIFDVPEVTAAKGGRYEQLRRNVRLFLNKNPGNLQAWQLDLRDKATHEYLIAALKVWQKEDKGFIKNDPHFDEEKALNRYFTHNSWCEAECYGYFLNGRIFGFSITHKPPQEGWVIFNHLKCSRSVPHGYDCIYYLTMHRLHKQGITKVNFEQDLGIPGLRIHKRQLGKSEFLSRYEITKF